jgi:hypothetical protein
MKQKPLVSQYGEMWARNTKNIGKIPGRKEGGQGVYTLYDGSMPVYVGKGNIRSRVHKSHISKRRREFWDHFSWYIISVPFLHDIEALLLRRLPWYMRGLNAQSGKFIKGRKIDETDPKPRPIVRRSTRPE